MKKQTENYKFGKQANNEPNKATIHTTYEPYVHMSEIVPTSPDVLVAMYMQILKLLAKHAKIDDLLQAVSIFLCLIVWTLAESTGVCHNTQRLAKKMGWQQYTQKFLEIYLGLLHPGCPSQKPTTATNKQK